MPPPRTRSSSETPLGCETAATASTAPIGTAAVVTGPGVNWADRGAPPPQRPPMRGTLHNDRPTGRWSSRILRSGMWRPETLPTCSCLHVRWPRRQSWSPTRSGPPLPERASMAPRKGENGPPLPAERASMALEGERRSTPPAERASTAPRKGENGPRRRPGGLGGPSPAARPSQAAYRSCPLEGRFPPFRRRGRQAARDAGGQKCRTRIVTA